MGTTAITGDNGIGKSTIFLAIEWAFYGSSHVRDIKPHGKNMESSVRVVWDRYEVYRSTKQYRYIAFDGNVYEDKDMDTHILRLFSTYKVFRSYIHIAQGSYNELLTSGLSDRESILYMHIIGDDDTIFETIRKIKDNLADAKEKYNSLKLEHNKYKEKIEDLGFDEEEYTKLDIEYPDNSVIKQLRVDFSATSALELDNYANMRLIEELKTQIVSTHVSLPELKDKLDKASILLEECKKRDKYKSVPIHKEIEIREKIDKYEKHLSLVDNPNEHMTKVFKYKKHLEDLERYNDLYEKWKIADLKYKNYLAELSQYEDSNTKYIEWLQYKAAQERLRLLTLIECPLKPEEPKSISKPGKIVECPCCNARLMYTDNQLVSEIITDVEWTDYQRDLQTYKNLLGRYENAIERYKDAQHAINGLREMRIVESVDQPIAPIVVEKPLSPVKPIFRETIPKTLDILDVSDLHKLRQQLDIIVKVKDMEIDMNLPDTYVLEAEYNSLSREYKRISKIVSINAIHLIKIKEYEKKISSPKVSSKEIQKQIDSIMKLREQREVFLKMQETKIKYDTYTSKSTSLDKKCKSQKDTIRKISALLQEVHNFFNLEVISRLDTLSTITNSLLEEFQLYVTIVFGITEKSERFVINYTIEKDGNSHKNTNFMSGGERAKLSLALTIALSTMRYTPFCLYDEIFSSVSQETQIICMEVMQKHLSGRPIVCIMHNHVEGLFDTTITLE